jgi:Na+-transporting NADH:ubiquinone oxidoreductase subunit C
MQREVVYTFVFAALVCAVCGVLVSSSAVALKPLQDANIEMERQRNVLLAAGLMEPAEKLGQEELDARFENIQDVMIDLATGREVPDGDPGSFDRAEVLADLSLSREAPDNRAGVARVALQLPIYQVLSESGEVEMVVLPVEGKGLWSTLLGYLALSADTETVRGLTFYSHKETPGLGGEVDNPRWKALWQGRQAFDADWKPALEVIKGVAGSPEEDPHRVDGLSGATITSRGVTHLLRFWLGEDGFEPYLTNLREGGAA